MPITPISPCGIDEYMLTQLLCSTPTFRSTLLYILEESFHPYLSISQRDIGVSYTTVDTATDSA